MTKKERKAVYEAILGAHADWHMCRLKKAERGMKAGRPCDMCIEEAKATLENLLEKLEAAQEKS